MKRENNYNLLGHNTFDIEARCRDYMEYESASEAADISDALQAYPHPRLVVGGGSNLLLTHDFDGAVISPAPRFDVEVSGGEGDEALVRCWSGTTFDDLVDWTVGHGYHGLENLSGIPGQVGASAVQNIGAYGAEAGEFIDSVEAVELSSEARFVVIPQSECHYGYRQSRFKKEWKGRFLITHVTYRLSRFFRPRLDYGNIRQALVEKLGTDVEAMEASVTPRMLRDTILEIRNAKLPDPKEYGNAGSFFMNPVVDEKKFNELKKRFPDLRYYPVESDDGIQRYKIPAGWMIDRCGWKGKTLGRAGVWPKQALVLYNTGGATGAEVLALCKAIQHDVRLTFGIDIYPEVNIC